MINADKVLSWRSDVAASVGLYNAWFFAAAPKAYRDTRAATIEDVKSAMAETDQMRALSPEVLIAKPGIISSLRMMTAPPLARDRLIGLSGLVSGNLIKVMEDGNLPVRMEARVRRAELAKICSTVQQLVDIDLMPWLATGGMPTDQEVHVAATVIADRLCGSVADPIIRNAQERRQLALIQEYLEARGYAKRPHHGSLPLSSMPRGTYSFRQIVVVGEIGTTFNIPIDVVVQPRNGHTSGLPVLIECKSAGDFTNTNKRRKEEAQKIHQLRTKYGPDVPFFLFLCGYFDSGYLGYEAAEGIDWIWEHRIEDMEMLGL